MSGSELEDLYGAGAKTEWLARGRNGSRLTYSGPGGALSAAFYDDRVVQIGTTISYYSTPNGVHVGGLAPSFADPQRRDAAVEKGELEQIEPGVYAWRGFVFENHSYCLRGEKAATQLVLDRVSGRIRGVFITDVRFLSYLPAHVTGTVGQGLDVFCAVQPVEP
jgi:hypothetical protein